MSEFESITWMDNTLTIHPKDWPDSYDPLAMSIKKWKFILDVLVKNKHVTSLLDGSTNTCALCHKYYSPTCQGCPVYLKTGQIHCLGSPYASMEHAREYETIVTLVKKEIEFLESLQENDA